MPTARHQGHTLQLHHSSLASHTVQHCASQLCLHTCHWFYTSQSVYLPWGVLFSHWRQVWENNPDEAIVMSSGLFQLGLGDFIKQNACITNWQLGFWNTFVFIRQGGSNKNALLHCIMGNVGSSIFGALWTKGPDISASPASISLFNLSVPQLYGNTIRFKGTIDMLRKRRITQLFYDFVSHLIQYLLIGLAPKSLSV